MLLDDIETPLLLRRIVDAVACHLYQHVEVGREASVLGCPEQGRGAVAHVFLYSVRYVKHVKPRLTPAVDEASGGVTVEIYRAVEYAYIIGAFEGLVKDVEVFIAAFTEAKRLLAVEY